MSWPATTAPNPARAPSCSSEGSGGIGSSVRPTRSGESNARAVLSPASAPLGLMAASSLHVSVGCQPLPVLSLQCLGERRPRGKPVLLLQRVELAVVVGGGRDRRRAAGNEAAGDEERVLVIHPLLEWKLCDHLPGEVFGDPLIELGDAPVGDLQPLAHGYLLVAQCGVGVFVHALVDHHPRVTHVAVYPDTALGQVHVDKRVAYLPRFPAWEGLLGSSDPLAVEG